MSRVLVILSLVFPNICNFLKKAIVYLIPNWVFVVIVYVLYCGASFPQMQKIGLEPSCYTYDFFIQVVASKRGFSDAIEVVSYILDLLYI